MDVALLDFDPWSLLLIIGVGQGTMLIFVLWFKKPTHLAIRILTFLLVVLGANLAEFLLLSSKYYVHIPHLTRVTHPFLFLIGPCFYFFVKAYATPGFKFKGLHALHLLPFIYAIIHTMPWFLMSADFKLNILERGMRGEVSGIGIKSFLYVLFHIGQTLTYTLLAFLWLRKVRETSASLSKHTLHKLKVLLKFNKAFLTYWILQLLGLITIMAIQYYVYQIDYVLALLNSIFIQLLTFSVLSSPNVLSNIEASKKYQRSSLDDQDKSLLLKKIKALAIDQALYLDSDLTLQKFCESLSVNKNYVSQVINEAFDQSFTDYINHLRIEKAKALMNDPANDWMKLLAIALDSGFNNKTSFNRVFTKKTGKTPSDYRKFQQALREKSGHN